MSLSTNSSISHKNSYQNETPLDILAFNLARTSSTPLLTEKRYQNLLKTYQDILEKVALLNDQGQLMLNQGFSDETSVSIVAGTLIYALERTSLELNWQGDRIWLGGDLVLFRLHDCYLYLQTQLLFRKQVDELLDWLKS